MSQKKDDIPESNHLLSKVPVLENPKDWVTWKRCIQNYLILAGLWGVVTTHSVAPKRKGLTAQEYPQKLARWKKKNRRAYASITCRLGTRPYSLIKGIEGAAQILETLESKFKPSGNTCFLELCRQLHTLTLGECKNVQDFTNKFIQITDELGTLFPAAAFPEAHIISCYLFGLGPTFSHFRDTFTQLHTFSGIAGVDGQREVTFFETTQAAEAEENRMALQYGGGQLMIMQAAEVEENRMALPTRNGQAMITQAGEEEENRTAQQMRSVKAVSPPAENRPAFTDHRSPVARYCEICRLENHTTEECGKKRNIGKHCDYCGYDFHIEAECKKKRRDRHQQKTMIRWNREYREPAKEEL